ncbi:MAG: hypothetical protein ACLVCH_16735 [Roseburia inulinivorans]
MTGKNDGREQGRTIVFLWEKISEGEIRLLRVFGEQPVVTVPGFIDGRCVRELGDYCFSRRKLPENEIRYSRYCGGMWESGLSVLKDKEKKDRISSEQGRKYYFFGNNRTGWKTARIIGKIYQRGTTSGRHCENRKLCVL